MFPFPLKVLFSPTKVLIRGFRYISGLSDITQDEIKDHHNDDFKSHYGSNSTHISVMWSDILMQLDLKKEDKSENRFKRLLIAIFFLWAYPKNAAMLASTFGVCKRLVQGEYLWYWVRIIGKLKRYKVIWPTETYNDPNSQIFIITVDGVDFKVTENRRHPLFPIDTGEYSQKFAHAAFKYEIGIDCFTGKIFWLNGPFRAGMHDRTIYNMGLKDIIPEGKMVVCDRVYRSKVKKENDSLSIPSLCDSKKLANFKIRLRCRHETFNGRIKNFASLSHTYHHDRSKHIAVFEAVCLMVIYQLENGNPLFTI